MKLIIKSGRSLSDVLGFDYCTHSSGWFFEECDNCKKEKERILAKLNELLKP